MKIALSPRKATEFDHELVWGSIGLIVLLAAWFFPFHYVSMPGCLFLRLTGLPCPSCGMTRCFIAMSRGDLGAAWNLSPLGAVLFVAAVGYIIYGAVVVVGGLPRVRIRFSRPLERRMALAAGILIVAANWIYLLVAR